MRKKTAAVPFDLTAAYDTIWHRSLRLKLLQTIPDHIMVAFIMENISNCEFTLRISDGQQSRPRRVKNDVPQGSILAPCLFNVYISDTPPTHAKQFANADDLAMVHSAPSWDEVEKSLNKDLCILNNYYHKKFLFQLLIKQCKINSLQFFPSKHHKIEKCLE